MTEGDFLASLAFWEAAGMAGKSKTTTTQIKLRAHAPKTTSARNEFKQQGIVAESFQWEFLPSQPEVSLSGLPTRPTRK